MNLSVGEAKQDQDSIFIGIIHDLTERKKTEEQLVQAQKMEAVGQLSGGIAHDFNNLLTVILGNSELLHERLRVREDMQRLAGMIRSAAERGAELTRRLLAFSRRQTLQPVATDCNQLILSMDNMLRRTLGENILIDLSLFSSLQTAFADPAQLESAILNLAINARDAIPKGGRLTIATALMPLDQIYSQQHPEVKPGHYVMISVTDDGCGMTPDVLARVFEPFYTTKEVGKGTGLGLSMVYGFIKQSNGHVSIYSEVGLGTSVRLYLPIASTVAENVNFQRAALSPHNRGEGLVLIAEDDPFVRTYAVECMESLGYSVVAASNGHEALKALGENPSIWLLFTDIVMPGGLSGLELAEAALKIRPDLRLLFTSGYALETLEAQGRIKPEWAILNKPYRKADLGQRLAEIRIMHDGKAET
ncbi:MAG: response regulator [Rhodospirillaceae bacterium]|nr:response regulator [Rhodospirillaceae bacterium]